jgi:hypothetical protein
VKNNRKEDKAFISRIMDVKQPWPWPKTSIVSIRLESGRYDPEYLLDLYGYGAGKWNEFVLNYYKIKRG